MLEFTETLSCYETTSRKLGTCDKCGERAWFFESIKSEIGNFSQFICLEDDEGMMHQCLK